MLLLILTLLGLIPTLVPQVRLDFQDAPLSRVLAQIDELYPDTSVHFILDEVAPYQVTMHTEADGPHDAVSQAIAGLPFSLRLEGHNLFVNISKTPDATEEPRDTANAIRSYYLQEVFVDKQLCNLLSMDEGFVLDLCQSGLQHRGSAIDILACLPGLSYSRGQIRSHNATSPIVYIDDVEVSSATELFSLRSEEISRVAYAESANSTYQSHNGGVIRIYTRKPTPGWDVQALSATTVGHRTSQTEQTRVGWNTTRLRMLADVGIGHTNEYQEHHTPDFDVTLTPSIPSVNAQLKLTFRPAPHHLIGARYEMLDITRSVAYWSRVSGMEGTFDHDNIADLKPWEEDDWSLEYSPRHDLRLYYEGRMDKCRIRLDIGYYHDAMQIIQHENLHDCLDNSGLIGQRINGIDNRLLTERLDIALPLGMVNLHVGNEYTSTQRRDAYLRQYFDVARMRMDRSEHQSALFALAEARCKGVRLEAGLRSEYLHATCHQAATAFSRKHNYLLPFAAIRMSRHHSELGLTYSLHTQRPAYEQLNGYTRFDQYILFISGNPDLEPSMHHRLDLTCRHRDLHYSMSYQHIGNYLASIITSDHGIYCMHYDNLPSAQEVMATLTYSPRLGRWQPIISSTLLAQDVNLSFNDGTHHSLHRPLWHIDVHSPFLLTPNAQLWLDGHYHTSGHRGTTLQGATGMLNLGFSYQLHHWNLTLQADDLLRTGATSFHGYGPGIDYHHSVYSDTQRLMLTLGYHLR